MSAWAGTRPEERTGARRPFRDAGSRPSALLRGRVGLRGVWPQQQAQVVADVARLDQLQLQPLRHLLDAQAGEQRAGVAAQQHRRHVEQQFVDQSGADECAGQRGAGLDLRLRSEEHTSELQSLMRNSYDVFCLKKKNNYTNTL